MSHNSTAYSDTSAPLNAHQVSTVERALLCDLLDAVGPEQPTLCQGWSTYDLVAHLKIREGSPIDQLRSILPGLADRAIASQVRSAPFEALVSAIRFGPPRLSIYGLPSADSRLNTLEFLVHHEDVRRVGPWEARTLPLWAEDQIWGRLTGFAKLIMRSLPVQLVLERTDRDPAKDPTAGALVSKGVGLAVVRGLPSELALYAFGRRDVAQVELDAAPEVLARLSRKSFGR